MPSNQPADCRDAIHWFVNNVGLYSASARGIFASDFSDDQEPVLEAGIINLKNRGINSLVIDGESLYQRSENLWKQALQQTRFGRPVVGNNELEMSGSDLLVLKNLTAPEAVHQLWYLFHHVLYPRALANKPVLITTELGRDEFVLYGAGCEDVEYAGRKVTWEKIIWLIDSTMVDLHHFQQMQEENLPPMLKAEYALCQGLKERGLPVHPQHVLGDYMLDIAAFEPQIRKRRDDAGPKLDIECDIISTIEGPGSHGQAKRNLLLLNDGWNILRFSMAEVQSDLNGCVDAAMEVWQQGRKRSIQGRLLTGQGSASAPELPVDDDVQRLAITHGGGPAAVEGGAGTGKSSCIIHRVANLIALGISPEKILVLSHSNETLRSLKAGVELLGDKLVAQRLNYYSWHDFGHKILKENLQAIKRKPPLKVENNTQKVIQRLLAKYKKELDPTMLELSEELDEFTIASLIGLYKANLITPKHLKERCKTEVDHLVAKVYQGYEDQLQKSNKIDRDDMIYLAALTLADQPDVRIKYQFQYEYILADEFQEATAAGDLLLRLAAFPQDSLYIVGNEDEAIFESKGGLPRLMSEVSIKLPNARCYVLEKNWRSHPTIVEHSKQLLVGMTRRRIQKDMIPGWGAPPAAAIIGPQMLATEEAEAEWVAEETSILIDSGRTPNEIAVLYRYHRYGLIIEESLSRRGIKCVTTHPEAGLIPDEVGDVMAFLRLVMDPDGPKARESFERVCQLRVKEVDPKLSATIASFAEANNLSYLKAVEIYAEAVAEPACRELEQLVKIVRTMHTENLPPADTIRLLKRTQRLNEYYKSIKVPPGVNYEPLRKLTFLEEEAAKFQSVSEFVKAQSAPAKTANGEPEHVVHILTLHEAKGKEFPVIFLVGLAEGLFPAESASDREEERRLCYVGMTRAREALYLSYPAIFNDVALNPSTFLYDAKLMPEPAAAEPVPEPVAPPPIPAALKSAGASAGPVPYEKPPMAPVPNYAKPSVSATPANPPQQKPAPVPYEKPPMAPVPNYPKPSVSAAPGNPVQQKPVNPPSAPVQQPPQPAPTQQRPAAAVPLQPQAAPPATPEQQPPQPVPMQQRPAAAAPQQQLPVPVQQPPQPAPMQQRPAAAAAQEQPPVPYEKPPMAPVPNYPKPSVSAAPGNPPPAPAAPAQQPAVPVQQPPQPAPMQQRPAAAVPQEQPPVPYEKPPMAPVPNYPKPSVSAAPGNPPPAPVAPAQQPAVPMQQPPQPAPMQQRPAASVPPQPQTAPPAAPVQQPPQAAPAQQAPTASPAPQQPAPNPALQGQMVDPTIAAPQVPRQLPASTAPQAVLQQPIPQQPLPQVPANQQEQQPPTGFPQQPHNVPPAANVSPNQGTPQSPFRQLAAPPAGSGAQVAGQPAVPAKSHPMKKPMPQQDFAQPPVSQQPPQVLQTDQGLPEDWFEEPSERKKKQDAAAQAARSVDEEDITQPMKAVPEALPAVQPAQAYVDEPQGDVPLQDNQVQIQPQHYDSYAGQAQTTSQQAQGSSQQQQGQGQQAHQAGDESVAEMLGGDAGTANGARRSVPQDGYWEKRFNTPQPKAAPKPVPVEEDEDIALDLNQRPPDLGIVPPTPTPRQPAAQAPQISPVSARSQPPPAAPAPPQPAALGVPQCPGCLLPLEAGSRFCGECGYQLKEKIPACHLCGAPLEPSAKFCGECGSKRGDATTSATDDVPTQRTWVNQLTKFMDEH